MIKEISTDAPVVAVAFQQDGTKLAAAFANKSVRIYQSGDGKELKKIESLPAAISAIAFRGDGGQLAIAGDDQHHPHDQRRRWKDRQGAQGAPGTNPRSGVFAKDGNHLFSASADKTAKLWDINQGKSVRDFAGHTDAVLALNVSRDGAKLVTGSADKTGRVWNVADGKVLATLTGHSGPVSSVFISDDGARIATGSADQSVR